MGSHETDHSGILITEALPLDDPLHPPLIQKLSEAIGIVSYYTGKHFEPAPLILCNEYELQQALAYSRYRNHTIAYLPDAGFILIGDGYARIAHTEFPADTIQPLTQELITAQLITSITASTGPTEKPLIQRVTAITKKDAIDNHFANTPQAKVAKLLATYCFIELCMLKGQRIKNYELLVAHTNSTTSIGLFHREEVAEAFDLLYAFLQTRDLPFTTHTTAVRLLVLDFMHALSDSQIDIMPVIHT